MLGAGLLTETIPVYLAGEIEPEPQEGGASTYAPMLSKKDGELDFSEPAEFLDRKVRAFSPWPGTFTHWKGQPLKIHQATAIPGTTAIGKRTILAGLPAISTSDGFLVLEKLQPAGKKVQDGKTFRRQYRLQ